METLEEAKNSVRKKIAEKDLLSGHITITGIKKVAEDVFYGGLEAPDEILTIIAVLAQLKENAQKEADYFYREKWPSKGEEATNRAEKYRVVCDIIKHIWR